VEAATFTPRDVVLVVGALTLALALAAWLWSAT
jgi:hypothetical protein